MKCHDGNSKEMVDKLRQKEMLSNEMIEAGFRFVEIIQESLITNDAWVISLMDKKEEAKEIYNDPTPDNP